MQIVMLVDKLYPYVDKEIHIENSDKTDLFSEANTNSYHIFFKVIHQPIITKLFPQINAIRAKQTLHN